MTKTPISIADLTFSFRTVQTSVGLNSELLVHYPEFVVKPYKNAHLAILSFGKPAEMMKLFLDNPNTYIVSDFEVVNDGYKSVNGPQSYGSESGNHYKDESYLLAW